MNCGATRAAFVCLCLFTTMTELQSSLIILDAQVKLCVDPDTSIVNFICSSSLELSLLADGFMTWDNKIILQPNQNVFLDERGLPWSPVYNFSARVHQTSDIIGVRTYVENLNNIIYNVYETITPLRRRACDPLSSICCDNTRRTLHRNETKYLAFEYDQDVYDPTWNITVTGGTGRAYTVSVGRFTSITTPTESGEEWTARFLSCAIAMPSIYRADETAITPLETDVEPFLVPHTFIHTFNKLPNTIALTFETYSAFTSCEDELGHATRVLDGDEWDQFQSFRPNLPSTRLKNCTYLYRNVDNSLRYHSCNYPSNATFKLTLPSADFSLRPRFGIPSAPYCGLFYLSPNEDNVVLFLQLSNSADYSGTFSVHVGSCCVHPTTNNSSSSTTTTTPSPSPSQTSLPACTTLDVTLSKSVPPHSTTPFRFQFFAPSLRDQSATCGMSVSQGLAPEFQYQCHIRGDPSSSLDPGVIPADPSGVCLDPSYILVLFGDTMYCRPPCTQDQSYDPDRIYCQPVNCSLKYAGTKNFYNSDLGLCQSIPLCTSSQTYDPVTNLCLDPPPSTSPTPTPPPTSLPTPSPPAPATSPTAWSPQSAPAPVSSTPSQSPITYPTVPSPATAQADLTEDCGENGTPDQTNSYCICDAGWETTLEQNSNGFVWCASATGRGNNISIAPWIVGLLLFLVLAFCIGFALLEVWRKKRKRGRDMQWNETLPGDYTGIAPSSSAITGEASHVRDGLLSLHSGRRELQHTPAP